MKIQINQMKKNRQKNQVKNLPLGGQKIRKKNQLINRILKKIVNYR